MNKLVPVAIGIAVAVAVAGCAAAGVPTPTQGANAPATTPTATASRASVDALPSASAPAPTAAAVTDLLAGGRYRFEAGDVEIEATGPDGWTGYPSWAMDGPDPVRADAPSGIGVVFLAPNGLYSDVCHWDVKGTGEAGTPGDVVVGPTVDDLVAALGANTSYTASAPKPVTVDGYAGQELELQLPDKSFAKCDKDDPADSGGHAFVFSGEGLYAQGPANRWHLYILDAHGTRLVAAILSYKGTPQADLDRARSVIDTLDINP